MNPRKISIWILRVLLALVFIGAGSNKLAGAPMMVAMFDRVGFGQGLRYLTGALEVGGGLATLYPRTSVYGAMVLFCVAVGAFVAQVTRLHMDWIHTVVLAAATGGLVLLQRNAIGRRISPDTIRRPSDPAQS